MKKNHPLSDLDADIRDHIERETLENIERGLAPEEARYAAVTEVRQCDIGPRRYARRVDSDLA